MSLISNYKKLKRQYTVQKRKIEEFQNTNHHEKEKKQAEKKAEAKIKALQ